MSDQDGWFMGCGSCGGNRWVRNAEIHFDKECEQCHGDGTIDDGRPYVLDSLVTTELGWCGCGDPEAVDKVMLAYLRSRAAEDWPDPEGVSDDAVLLLAYIADALRWTEHGSSVGGAWLTDDGRKALANLEAATTDG